MALVLHRLRSGLIYSQAFADYLESKHNIERLGHQGDVLHLDYVRCGQGDLSGQEWWQLMWISGWQAPTEHRHQIGDVEVYIPKQAMRGLKNRMLHFDGQNVVVKR
ncbi:hypothetical protein [Prosthecobacter sp.]|uniref:hypothetical protein n=1 Tax=Prosthecobacter sp. TaxID=1965333 RepID=UPI002ABB1557|nr:hypothetical protein [Prosthecobacter sp.]MDZ4403669.1 hypothetical protein [Prosthecobacter sp.]